LAHEAASACAAATLGKSGSHYSPLGNAASGQTKPQKVRACKSGTSAEKAILPDALLVVSSCLGTSIDWSFGGEESRDNVPNLPAFASRVKRFLEVVLKRGLKGRVTTDSIDTITPRWRGVDEEVSH
jgi:hypothetical protein